MVTDKERIAQLERELGALQARVDHIYRTFGLTGEGTTDELRQRVTMPAPAPK